MFIDVHREELQGGQVEDTPMVPAIKQEREVPSTSTSGSQPSGSAQPSPSGSTQVRRRRVPVKKEPDESDVVTISDEEDVVVVKQEKDKESPSKLPDRSTDPPAEEVNREQEMEVEDNPDPDPTKSLEGTETTESSVVHPSSVREPHRDDDAGGMES